jgi:hypothetical protein
MKNCVVSETGKNTNVKTESQNRSELIFNIKGITPLLIRPTRTVKQSFYFQGSESLG